LFAGVYELIPIDAQLAQPSAIFYGRRIRTSKVQFFTQVEGQLLGTLRFNDRSILLEGKPVSPAQVFVCKVTGKISTHKSEKPRFIPGYRTAKKDIGLPLAAAGLPPLNDQHKWKNEFVGLSGAFVWLQPVHGLGNVVLKPAVDGRDRNGFAFRIVAIPQCTRMHPGEM
jgi:hypothetical protein